MSTNPSRSSKPIGSTPVGFKDESESEFFFPNSLSETENPPITGSEGSNASDPTVLAPTSGDTVTSTSFMGSSSQTP
ncbi:hypothetical protein P9112_009806 [Eukaryota sp. TZLM1-RC]